MAEIGTNDFTIEGWYRPVRSVRWWRGRKFVIAPGWVRFVGRVSNLKFDPRAKYATKEPSDG